MTILGTTMPDDASGAAHVGDTRTGSAAHIGSSRLQQQLAIQLVGRLSASGCANSQARFVIRIPEGSAYGCDGSSLRRLGTQCSRHASRRLHVKRQWTRCLSTSTTMPTVVTL